MAWNQAQQIALAMVPKVSSVLSLFGSIWISVEVLTGKQWTRRTWVRNISHPYHRLLLAMSIYDILESVWNFASTWPIPAGTQGVYDARGTTATCSAQGFFLTLSVAVPIYNACLSLYYVLVVNYSMTDTQLKKKVEPAMHAVAFVWAFGTALVSAGMGLINNANLWCWIAPYPGDCLDSRRYGEQGNCERGDNAWIYRWAFYFAPLWGCILFATICTLMVCAKVKGLDRRTLLYRQPHRTSFVDAEASAAVEDGTVLPADTPPPTDAPDADVSKWNVFARWWKQRQTFLRDNPRTVEVQRQAALYLLVFALTHVWSTSNRIVQQLNSGRTYFGLIAIHSFFDPLQGFLNFLVYQRPKYVKIRKVHPDLGPWQALKKTLVWSCLDADGPRDVSRSRRSSVPRRVSFLRDETKASIARTSKTYRANSSLGDTSVREEQTDMGAIEEEPNLSIAAAAAAAAEDDSATLMGNGAPPARPASTDVCPEDDGSNTLCPDDTNSSTQDETELSCSADRVGNPPEANEFKTVHWGPPMPVNTHTIVADGTEDDDAVACGDGDSSDPPPSCFRKSKENQTANDVELPLVAQPNQLPAAPTQDVPELSCSSEKARNPGEDTMSVHEEGATLDSTPQLSLKLDGDSSD